MELRYIDHQDSINAKIWKTLLVISWSWDTALQMLLAKVR